MAVSGGCDSIALLHILLSLRAEIPIALHVASLNHGLRGADGGDDVVFVAGLADAWGLPATTAEVNVPDLAREWGIGIEEAGRRARYDFLAGVARNEGGCVVVGQHADDQAETILMRIVRGSGLRGLQGMRVVGGVPGHGDIRLVRPLLKASRDEIEAYCHDHGLEYRRDRSNDDLRYSRNFLRHEVMARLRRLNGRASDAFARLAEAAAVDDDFISSQFTVRVLPNVTSDVGHWSIGRDEFWALHPALQRRFLRGAFGHCAGGAATLDHRATVAAIAWLRTATTGARRQLGQDVRARVGYAEIVIENAFAEPAAGAYRLIANEDDIELNANLPLTYCGLRIDLAGARPIAQFDAWVELPAGVDLRLRTRRPGERFKPKGMGGRSRKIKDWMIDRKIPREIRQRIPLISADDTVIAICVGDQWHLADASANAGHGGERVTLWLR